MKNLFIGHFSFNLFCGKGPSGLYIEGIFTPKVLLIMSKLEILFCNICYKYLSQNVKFVKVDLHLQAFHSTVLDFVG